LSYAHQSEVEVATEFSHGVTDITA